MHTDHMQELPLLCRGNESSVRLRVPTEGPWRGAHAGSLAEEPNLACVRLPHRETVRLLARLHQFDVMRANKAPFAFGLEPRVPFLDKAFLETSMSVDPTDKMVRMHAALFSRTHLPSAMRHCGWGAHWPRGLPRLVLNTSSPSCPSCACFSAVDSPGCWPLGQYAFLWQVLVTSSHALIEAQQATLREHVACCPVMSLADDKRP